MAPMTIGERGKKLAERYSSSGATNQAVLPRFCPTLPAGTRPETSLSGVLLRRATNSPRVVTLVNLEKQLEQGRLPNNSTNHGSNEDLFPPSSELAYRDADYDTDPGVSMTRPRAIRAVVDIRKSTGRDWSGGRDEEQRGYRSDGEGAGGLHVTREGKRDHECTPGDASAPLNMLSLRVGVLFSASRPLPLWCLQEPCAFFT